MASLFGPIIHEVSTATADTPLRQAWLRFVYSQAGRLAFRDLNILFQVCFGLSSLRVPVSLASRRSRGQSVLAVSSRTVMNNAG